MEQRHINVLSLSGICKLVNIIRTTSVVLTLSFRAAVSEWPKAVVVDCGMRGTEDTQNPLCWHASQVSLAAEHWITVVFF